MKIAKGLVATLAFAAFSLLPKAHAAVIDFNGMGGTNVPENTGYNAVLTVFNSGTSFTTNGFRFSIGATGFGGLMTPESTGGDSDVTAFNGSDVFIGYAGFIISRVAPGPFSVSGVDLAAWVDGQGVTQATLTGTTMGGTTIIQVIDLSTITNASRQTGNDLTTYALSGFDDLSSLMITQNGFNYLALDNLIVGDASVPEPSSLALFGLALAGCVFVRRRTATSVTASGTMPDMPEVPRRRPEPA